MKTQRTGKRKQSNKSSAVGISPRSTKMLDQSCASLKRLASVPIVEPARQVRLGTLKGRIEIKGDIIHSDMEDDWEVQ